MPGKPKTTIYDIAKELGISPPTVSRALHDDPRISETTKKKVLKTARELNYTPNQNAVSLRNGKSYILGILVPKAEKAFFDSVVMGIEEIATQHHYKILICQSNDDPAKEAELVNTLLSTRVDGIIASIGRNTEDFSHFAKIKEEGIPLVLFDSTTDLLEVSQVVVDNYLGAYKVVEHLIQQGYQRIAHFTGSRKIKIFQERLKGYKDALYDNSLPFDEELVVESNLQLEDGRNGMERLLQLEWLPDALFSATDYGAMGAMQVLKEKNLKVPQDMALAGFGNEQFTVFSDPPLTTVEQFSLAMGRNTAEILFQQIKSNLREKASFLTVLKPDLIIRQSSMKIGEEVYPFPRYRLS